MCIRQLKTKVWELVELLFGFACCLAIAFVICLFLIFFVNLVIDRTNDLKNTWAQYKVDEATRYIELERVRKAEVEENK